MGRYIQFTAQLIRYTDNDNVNTGNPQTATRLAVDVGNITGIYKTLLELSLSDFKKRRTYQ